MDWNISMLKIHQFIIKGGGGRNTSLVTSKSCQDPNLLFCKLTKGTNQVFILSFLPELYFGVSQQCFGVSQQCWEKVLYRITDTNKYRRNAKNGKYPFCNPNEMVDLSNSHKWLQKSLGERLMGRFIMDQSGHPGIHWSILLLKGRNLDGSSSWFGSTASVEHTQWGIFN